MAFGGGLYGSFTTNCLDDIPFKLGPKFKPPTKVVLPTDFHTISQSRVLQEEYTFEVEEAVLKWSAEREKQFAEQRKLEREITESNRQGDSDDEVQGQPDGASAEPEYANSQPRVQPLYENSGILLPKPAPRPRVKPKPKDDYVNVLFPNPIIANISNDILKPTPSGSPGENGETVKSDSNLGTKSNNIDLTWFEKEDDPFDNLELQTINDMEELASVLEETKKVSPEPSTVQEASLNGPILNDGNVEQNDDIDVPDGETDSHNYENVELKLVDLKIGSSENIYENSGAAESLTELKNLPPVPPRRDLVGRSPPLPPIGQSNSDPSFSKTVNQSSEQIDQHSHNSDSSNSINASFQNDESRKVISNRRVALPKPPRTFQYSRHNLDDIETVNKEETANEIKPTVSIAGVGTSMNVQFTNSHITENSKSDGSLSEDLNFVQYHFGEEEARGVNGTVRPLVPQRKAPAPPPRPQQPWNRYSPLPPTPRSVSEQPSTVSLPSVVSVGNQQDLYSQLSTEAQGCVDRLVTMGFQKERVARAVEKIGRDEKEVVEYLCLVDQLIEKGYSTYLAENALLLFKNSMNQACTYLELFTQLQELGFSGEKIKEALVNTNNDREKTLDILTASS